MTEAGRPPPGPDGSAARRMAAWLDGFDAFAFDCDGVLLDSNALKVSAFRSTLAAAGCGPELVEAFSSFQSRNFGLSRHRLFRRLLDGEFGAPPAALDMAPLLAAFGEACSAGYLEVAETDGMAETVAALASRAPLYVVSGSDEAELGQVFERRGLRRHFAAIYGSPTSKADNVARVLADLDRAGRPRRRVLFVGDAEADLDAALAHGLAFLFVRRYSTVPERMDARVAAAGARSVDTLAALWSAAPEPALA